jgi:hypothetical protein
MHEKIDIDELLSYVYFSFTTLSSVGFGDYHPISTSEKVFMIFILYSGNFLFGLVIGNFNEIMNSARKIVESFEEQDSLQVFF